MANPTLTLAQSVKAKNTQILKPYLAVRSISELEWELLQFNLHWNGLYKGGGGDYLTSFPAGFDYKAMRFHANIWVQEKRDYTDPDPFFSLPKPKREAILQGAVNQFVELLAQSFPEIKNNRRLIFIDFRFRQADGEAVVAKYENGLLSMSE